ncbi:YpdA family putative bacillithiol disulfide reductase [Aneurinibacillus sp. UBA3580]|jgi:thioredoxin reductase (NADPH)|uniref:YpdA family putative bacillithiol disulfide reductase n=1 Tax=Aneurinibacillus sp. UBA3580 TaxID=1946041 RepID=UPI0025809896|nr:YpdA family putative bacillithiol disulfide reductase [Aneurinibacillus sp. UBA3580]
MEQVIIIGAGPCGMSAAAELQNKGINPLIIEKGCIVNSIYGYPTFMNFFSTPELLEIGGIPFVISHEKPTRQEALTYYREVAARREFRIHTYEKVDAVDKQEDGTFTVRTTKRNGEHAEYRTRFVVIATGYYDNPNYMNIPGEDLPKVSHYFKEAHPYQGMKVAVIGGKNSSVDAAMDLYRAGADVTWIYRGSEYSPSIKAWVRPVFESMVNKGWIKAMFGTEVKSIHEDHIIVEQDGQEMKIENDAVFAMTGYRPDRTFFHALGVTVREETGEPEHNPETMETNVPGVFVAGVIAAGNDANVIFIENGRFHGGILAKEITRRTAGLTVK